MLARSFYRRVCSNAARISETVRHAPYASGVHGHVSAHPLNAEDPWNQRSWYPSNPE